METIHGWFCWFLDHPPFVQHAMVFFRWLHLIFVALWAGLALGIMLRGRVSPVEARWYRLSASVGFIFGLNLLHMRYGFPSKWYGAGATGLWIAVSASLGSLVLMVAAMPIGARLASHDPLQQDLGLKGNKNLLLWTVPLSLGMVVGAHGGLGWEKPWLEVTVGMLFSMVGAYFLWWIVNKEKKAQKPKPKSEKKS